MPEPDLTEVGGWIYDALRPLAEPYDEQRGYPLATYADAIGKMFQPVYDVVDDVEIVLDPDLTPLDWLSWLAQFVGQPIGGGKLPAETDEAYRARVKPLITDPPHRRRGTVRAVTEAVQEFLNPPRTVFVTERVGGHWCVGTLGVLSAQLKVGATVPQIQAAVNKVKAAGRQITVSAVTGGDWQTLRDTHTDWSDVRSTFVDWAEVRSNPSKQ